MPLPSHIRNIFFDLDDTLLNYHRSVEKTWRAVCSVYFPASADPHPDKVYHAIREAGRIFWSDAERHKQGRNNIAEARRTIVRAALQPLVKNWFELGGQVADEYSAKIADNIELFPDALPTLQTLQQNGVKLALFTNGESSVQRQKIDKFDLGRFFPYILIEGEQGTGKPETGAYLNALARTGFAPARTAMVGDNLEWDVFGPMRFGINGIWVNRLEREAEESEGHPDLVIKSLSELVS